MRRIRGVCSFGGKPGTFGGGSKMTLLGGGLFRPFLKGRNFYKNIYIFLKIIVDFLGEPPWRPFFDPKKGSLFGQFSDFWGPFRGGTPGKVLL